VDDYDREYLIEIVKMLYKDLERGKKENGVLRKETAELKSPELA
jgi:hypothetical protein